MTNEWISHEIKEPIDLTNFDPSGGLASPRAICPKCKTDRFVLLGPTSKRFICFHCHIDFMP